MDSIQQNVLDKRIRGWEWVREQLAERHDFLMAEAERLLGPERGE